MELGNYCESESYSSSIESGVLEEDRVLLRVSENLKEILEYDNEMIVIKKKQHILPAKVTVLHILEDFVKQSTVKLLFCNNSSTENNQRRRFNSVKIDRREKDFEKLMKKINLLKEVADGIRIYFDFTIYNHLLYAEEEQYVANSIIEKKTKENFIYNPSSMLSSELIFSKNDLKCSYICDESYEKPQLQSMSNTTEENQKRRLRSHRDEACKIDCADYLNGINSPRSRISITPPKCSPTTSVKSDNLKTPKIPQHIDGYFQKILSWQMIPQISETESSMIFGAIHLARLIVRLPEFLNASGLPDDKLKILLRHLDSFIRYLESHKEWFGEQNYIDIST